MDFKNTFVCPLLVAAMSATAAFGASILPAPSFQSSLNTQSGVGNLNSSVPGTLSRGLNYITVGAFPAPFIDAHDQEGSQGQSGVGASISYTLGLIGGTGGDHIPVTLDFYLFTSAAAGADDGGAVINSDAAVSLGGANGNSGDSKHISCGNIARGQDCSVPSWAGTLSIVAWVGYDVNVSLSASAGVCCGAGATAGNAYARINSIYIDPTFAALHPEYSLVLPEGVGNTAAESSTPEPASLALVLSGLAALTGFMRRKPKSPVTAIFEKST